MKPKATARVSKHAHSDGTGEYWAKVRLTWQGGTGWVDGPYRHTEAEARADIEAFRAAVAAMRVQKRTVRA